MPDRSCWASTARTRNARTGTARSPIRTSWTSARGPGRSLRSPRLTWRLPASPRGTRRGARLSGWCRPTTSRRLARHWRAAACSRSRRSDRGTRASSPIASDSYWRKTGGQADIIGKTVTLSGRPFTVVGVARPGFTGQSAAIAPEFWLPLGASRAPQERLHARGRGEAAWRA